MSSPTKMIKTEDNEGGSGRSKRIKQEDTDDNNNNNSGGSGGGGNGGGDGGDGDDGSPAPASGGSSRRRPSLREGSANRPSDLVLVGKILDIPVPEFQSSGVGKRIKVAVRTWMVDLYRASEWWIELPNVDDVVDEHRRKVMVRAKCNGFISYSDSVEHVGPPSEVPVSSLRSVTNGRHGSACLQGINLLLYCNGDPFDNMGWDMVSGTPPAWFAAIWNRPGSAPLADEFKGAKVYVTKDRVLNEQREWLD
eukprot:527128_1